MPFSENQPAYLRLRKVYAERRKDIALWIGAGVSRPAGLPTWPELRDRLYTEAMDTIVTLKEEEAKKLEDELSKVQTTTDFWDAFEVIRRILGEPNYRASIRDIFEAADEKEPPELYKEIWELHGVTSLLTLNIDEFAARAHRRVRPTEDIASFSGRDAGDYLGLIRRRKPFIANLHGVHENASSWIFTRSDLRSLHSDEKYKNLIRYIFSDLTVVFLGISADDVAAGGLLAELNKLGIDLGQHFWITSRRDGKTADWANQAGIQTIRYEPEAKTPGGDGHTAVLQKILRDLRSYVSRDVAAPAVRAPVTTRGTLPSAKELRAYDDDALRTALSGFAKGIIERTTAETESDEYVNFLRDYSPAIHQAWHLTAYEPYNTFYGYQVVEKVSSGPFSNVWKIVGSDGDSYALKVIQIDNLEKGAQIESFRRGVQSMQYLAAAHVEGTAKLVAAYEIPTCVIMEFVEGANLSEVVQSGLCDFWEHGLSILANVCLHIEESHALPQGILHRDIRPSNIMVPYFYWPEESIESARATRHDVVLLNYDMSWHTQARGKTIECDVREAGYYAPEQIADINAEQSRSTFVDSYGVGMTIFYCFTGSSPPPGGSKSLDWLNTLAVRFRAHHLSEWKSAPERIRRLIELSTSVDPLHRPTVRHIRAELTQIGDAISGRRETLSPDFWAEEVFAHVLQVEYEADMKSATFWRELKAGRSCSIQGRLKTNSIVVRFNNQQVEATKWSGLVKRWHDKMETAKEILASGGWTVLETSHYAWHEILLEAEISIPKLRSNFSKACKSLERGLDQVRLD